MKKNSLHTRVPHTLSSIARSATLFGSCLAISGTVHAKEMDTNGMKPQEGTGGGEENTPLVSGGTHAVSIAAVSGQKFAITLTVTCTSTTDYVSCLGTIFSAAGILTSYTTQGTCSGTGGVYLNTFTAASNSGCTVGNSYSLNFFCQNQTTHTNTNYSSGATAAFTCTA